MPQMVGAELLFEAVLRFVALRLHTQAGIV